MTAQEKLKEMSKLSLKKIDEIRIAKLNRTEDGVKKRKPRSEITCCLCKNRIKRQNAIKPHWWKGRSMLCTECHKKALENYYKK